MSHSSSHNPKKTLGDTKNQARSDVYHPPNDQHPAQTTPQAAGPIARFVSSEEAATWFVEVEDYAMFIMDQNGLIASWNPGVERILHYHEHEFIGQEAALIFTPEDVQQGAHLQEMETALREGRAIDERWHLRKDGSRFWASGILTLLRDETGQPCGFAKIMRDKTRSKLWEEEREQLLQEALAAREKAEEAQVKAEEAQAQAEKINEHKNHFITVISHELRTPLTTICGWLSLLRMQTLDQETTTVALDTLWRNADSMVHLVNELLDIEQMRSGRFQLQSEPTHLMPLIATTLQELRPQAQNKSIHLHTKFDSNDDLILGDRPRLEQVLRNLLSNAIKFTPGGGTVTVGLAREDGQTMLCVSDTGKGVPPEMLSHIFEEFRQVDESDMREHGGLGLGLAIVHELVKLHGGSIEAHSEGLDQGTTFQLRFPAMT